MTPSDSADAAKSIREFAMQQAAEAAELRVKVRRLERDNERLLRRLNRVYSSWTWRAGRLVLFPYYGLSWLINKLRAHRNT
jgi:hypothetical protein